MDIMDKIVNPSVHFLLQTIIISMAVNNLQGEMILIYHTQEVSDGRTSVQKSKRVENVIKRETVIKRYRNYLQLSG